MKRKIVSLNIGMPKPFVLNNEIKSSGFIKKPVEYPVFLRKFNLDGDGQGDLTVHGGIDKAVCVYPVEHYPFWERELGEPLSFSSFGENMSILGATEETVYIGDVFGIGETIVQVSQPRQPCVKLAVRHQRPDLIKKFRETGYTGYYFRVIQEGYVQREDEVILLEQGEQFFSVARANAALYGKSEHIEIERLASIDALSDNLKNYLLKRLKY